MTGEYITRAQLLLQYYDALGQLADEERARQINTADCFPEMVAISESAVRAAL
jgi:hypothetical protein